jgi:hypothetical protein
MVHVLRQRYKENRIGSVGISGIGILGVPYCCAVSSRLGKQAGENSRSLRDMDIWVYGTPGQGEKELGS